ncbi:hypothetical protein HDE_13965 [Halotydeus destructor]|nr:hypothetical protein HDE_13965 [Halotydeus destructor]
MLSSGELTMESWEGKITLPKIWRFVKQLKMEFFMFLLIVSGVFKGSVKKPLYQDKICTTVLHQPYSVCFNVTSSGYSAHEAIKDEILKESLNYDVYADYITTIPSLIYAMFLGSWSDRFPKGRKIMMYAGCLGIFMGQAIDMVNVVFFNIPAPYLLVSILPSLFLGGGVALHTAINSQILNNTPKDMRALRMAVMQVILGVARPIFGLLPAYMLEGTPWFSSGQLRNYVGVFTISFIFFSPAIFWVYFMIEVKDPKRELVSPDVEFDNFVGETPGDKNTGEPCLLLTFNMSVTANMETVNAPSKEPGWDTLFKFFMNGELLDGFRFTLIRNQTNGTPLVYIATVKNRRAGAPVCSRRWDMFQLKNALFDEKWKHGEVTVIDDTNRKIVFKLRSEKNSITIKLVNKVNTFSLELPLKYLATFGSTLHSIYLMLGAKRLFDDEKELREEVMVLLLAELVRKELLQPCLMSR